MMESIFQPKRYWRRKNSQAGSMKAFGLLQSRNWIGSFTHDVTPIKINRKVPWFFVRAFCSHKNNTGSEDHYVINRLYEINKVSEVYLERPESIQIANKNVWFLIYLLFSINNTLIFTPVLFLPEQKVETKFFGYFC